MRNSQVTVDKCINTRLDTSLGTARPYLKLMDLRNAYLATADESLITEMLLLHDRERGNFDNAHYEYF